MSHDSRKTGPWPPVLDTDLPRDIVLARLKGVRVTGSGWTACCPAHADSQPSLSITEDPATHKLLLFCHSGPCTAEAIMTALGLSTAHLFATRSALRHSPRAPRPYASPAPPEPITGDIEIDPAFDQLARHYRSEPGFEHFVEALAEVLGVAVRPLHELGVGWTGIGWSLPECDHTRRVVGISYRWPDGHRTSERGGRRGLYVSCDLPYYGDTRDDNTLYLCEGLSDTAALLSVGAAAIGRPAARSSALATHWLCELIAAHVMTRPVLVVGDDDGAGIGGAKYLAAQLSEHFGIAIGWALPAEPHNDVRAQINAGEWARGLRVSFGSLGADR